jgi:hypothetical protein
MQTALLDGKPAPPGTRFAASVGALAALLLNKPKTTPAKADASWIGSLFHR